MASNLRVDSIVPATGSSVSIGTATGGVNIPGVLTYEDVTNVDSIGVVTARSGINVVGNDLNVGSNIKLGNASGIVTATAFHGDGSALTGVGASFGNSSINTSGIITATSFTGNVITDKIVPTGGVPSGGGGGIIQVKQTVVKTHESRAGNGVTNRYDIPGMSISITPKFATSKILVRYHANISQTSADGNGILRLIKDASIMSAFVGSDGTVQNGSSYVRVPSHWQIGSFSNEILDTAGTTNAITYQLQWSMESGRTIYLNRRGGSAEYGTVSTITAMEVSA